MDEVIWTFLDSVLAESPLPLEDTLAEIEVDVANWVHTQRREAHRDA